MATPALIAIDWGTTSARSYCLDEHGKICDQRSLPLGIANIQDGRFAEASQQLVASWDDRLPCLACGMIGSRQGWKEAPYVECPASLDRLAGGVVKVDRLSILPGLITRDARGIPDVMRGEETQILGAVSPDEPRVIAVLPGTHSKWAIVEQGTVVDFATFMTGELYAVLLDHSILGRMAARSSTASHGPAFIRGVEHGLKTTLLTHDLFAARTLALTGELAPSDVDPWLSGLLIGIEILYAGSWIKMTAPSSSPVRIIGSDKLCDRYGEALSLAGIGSERGPADAAARGLWRIARQAGISG
jgi:2-dehydro-3-deoxygalactonokinase